MAKMECFVHGRHWDEQFTCMILFHLHPSLTRQILSSFQKWDLVTWNALPGLRFSVCDSVYLIPKPCSSPQHVFIASCAPKLKCWCSNECSPPLQDKGWWSPGKMLSLVTSKSYFFSLSFCNLGLSRVKLPPFSLRGILVSHSCL